jgi:hypothetical protein
MLKAWLRIESVFGVFWNGLQISLIGVFSLVQIDY